MKHSNNLPSSYTTLDNDIKFKKMRDKFQSLKKIEEINYKEIHTKNLVPLNIKINCKIFEEEISQLHPFFEQFGITYTNLPRYGLGLTNLKTPVNSTPSVCNWPMDVWNLNNPDFPLHDTDFTEPTQYFKSLSSLNEFKYFEGHYARCNILWWKTGAHFKPHVDVGIPATNLRLWGTNDPDNNHFCFWDDDVNDFVEEKNVEPGRLYLADTSKLHHAYSTGDYVYTFFFALQVSAFDLIKKVLL